MNNEKTVAQEFKDAITDDTVPLDKKAPGSSFAVVALTYLIMLLATVGLVGMLLWLFQ